MYKKLLLSFQIEISENIESFVTLYCIHINIEYAYLWSSLCSTIRHVCNVCNQKQSIISFIYENLSLLIVFFIHIIFVTSIYLSKKCGINLKKIICRKKILDNLFLIKCVMHSVYDILNVFLDFNQQIKVLKGGSLIASC